MRPRHCRRRRAQRATTGSAEATPAVRGSGDALLPPTADAAAALMPLIQITMGFVTAPLRFIITSTELVMQSGVLKLRIALGEILRHPSSTLAADRSLPPDQPAVWYRAGPHSRPNGCSVQRQTATYGRAMRPGGRACFQAPTYVDVRRGCRTRASVPRS